MAYDARNILMDCQIFRDANGFLPDCDELSSDQMHALLEVADFARYRKPKHANGSRGRYFYSRMKRQADALG
jgi:hypothetical protein